MSREERVGSVHPQAGDPAGIGRSDQTTNSVHEQAQSEDAESWQA